jgi:hypothetical protein
VPTHASEEDAQAVGLSETLWQIVCSKSGQGLFRVHPEQAGLGRVEKQAAAHLGVTVECVSRDAHVVLPFPCLLLLLHHLPSTPSLLLSLHSRFLGKAQG